eukprot:1148729_1
MRRNGKMMGTMHRHHKNMRNIGLTACFERVMAQQTRYLLTTCTMAQPCCIFSKPIDTQSQLKILEPINTCRDDGPRYTNSSLVFGTWCGHSDDAYSQSMLSFKWINFILFGFNIDETVRCVQFNPMSTQLTSTYVLMITV